MKTATLIFFATLAAWYLLCGGLIQLNRLLHP